MLRDATAWLAAALIVHALAVNAAWWAGEHVPPFRARRIDAWMAVGRMLYLGALPLAALGLGVAPLWLAGWTMPASWPAAAAGAAVAAAAGAAAVWLPEGARPLGSSGGRGRRPSAARVGAACADVVLREAHWGFVRAGVVAAAPGWFAVPGGTHEALGQAVILGVLALEYWVHPHGRHLAMDAHAAPEAPAIGAAAAASHLGWLLAGTAGAGLAAHAVVALVALVLRGEPAGRPVEQPTIRP